jgi:hypothetical protein
LSKKKRLQREAHMTGLQLPEGMWNPQAADGGLQSMRAESLGFQDPAANRNVALASEFVDGGFNVVTTATRIAGHNTDGYEAYKEIKESGTPEHQPTLQAVSQLDGGALRIEEKQHIETQSTGMNAKKDGPGLV